MDSSKRDLFAASIIFVIMLSYGVWLMVRAASQIKNPDDLGRLGVGWFLWLVEATAARKPQKEIGQTVVEPSKIRLIAWGALVASILMIGVALIAILILWTIK